MPPLVERTPRIAASAAHAATVAPRPDGRLALPVQRDGVVIGSANARLTDGGEGLVLGYAGRREQVLLVPRSQPFGGHLVLFLCPVCERAVRHLYDIAARFRCRECSGLAYEGRARHRVLAYEHRVKPRRALAQILVRLAKVRSPTKRAALFQRGESMLALLEEGEKRNAASVAAIRTRQAMLEAQRHRREAARSAEEASAAEGRT